MPGRRPSGECCKGRALQGGIKCVEGCPASVAVFGWMRAASKAQMHDSLPSERGQCQSVNPAFWVPCNLIVLAPMRLTCGLARAMAEKYTRLQLMACALGMEHGSESLGCMHGINRSSCCSVGGRPQLVAPIHFQMDGSRNPAACAVYWHAGHGLVCFIGSIADIKAPLDEVAYAASKWCATRDAYHALNSVLQLRSAWPMVELSARPWRLASTLCSESCTHASIADPSSCTARL